MTKLIDSEMQQVVPAHEVPMQQVQNTEELRQALTRIHKEGLPGFIIRAAGLMDEGSIGHEAATEAVREALSEAGQAYEIGMHLEAFSLQLERGTGPLHTDAVFPEHTSIFNVHTTKEGNGKVVYK